MLMYLIRHAVTPVTGTHLAGHAPGPHLSEKGQEQARALAKRLDAISIDAIYSSALYRALETAKPLSAAKKLRVRVRDGLEDTHYGEWEGRSLKVLAGTKQWRRLLAHPSSSRFPGGETLAETACRVQAAVGAIVEAHPKESVAIFTHADPIRMSIAHYAGAHPDMFMRLSVAPASVSVIWCGEGSTPRVLKVNDTGSLDELARVKR